MKRTERESKGFDVVQQTLVFIALVLSKVDTYVPPQPRIRNTDSYTNFLAKIYLQT